MSKQILIASDAWYPQVSGVVRTLEKMIEYRGDNELTLLTPEAFGFGFPCPMYSELQLTIPSMRKIKSYLKSKDFDHIHILTEGPIGFYTLVCCRELNYFFTTSMLTRFDQYIGMRIPYTEKPVRKYLKWFHSQADKTFISTFALMNELKGYGFSNLRIIPKGVDTDLFKPRLELKLKGSYPKLLYVGRVSKEKNLDAFLNLKTDAMKIVVGGGPSLKKYMKKYDDTHFMGVLEGEELAKVYSSADVFVFPSVTETFGLVMIEAMASGIPVAALPSDASKNLIKQGYNGYVDDDLLMAIKQCLTIDGHQCRLFSMDYDWQESARVFYNEMVKK